MDPAKNKVLLIEDDPDILSLLQTLLTIEGYQAVAVREQDSDLILAQLRREIPRVVLIDVNLRGTSGFDLLSLIRADSKLKDVRVLMSSGMDLSTECIRLGADAFILKPYMPAELLDCIRSAMEG